MEVGDMVLVQRVLVPIYTGDMSHTQFGVMGLWYGYRYLGKTFDSDTTTQAVKSNLFRYLKSSFVSSNGQFGYNRVEPAMQPPHRVASGVWAWSV